MGFGRWLRTLNFRLVEEAYEELRYRRDVYCIEKVQIVIPGLGVGELLDSLDHFQCIRFFVLDRVRSRRRSNLHVRIHDLVGWKRAQRTGANQSGKLGGHGNTLPVGP